MVICVITVGAPVRRAGARPGDSSTGSSHKRSAISDQASYGRNGSPSACRARARSPWANRRSSGTSRAASMSGNPSPANATRLPAAMPWRTTAALSTPRLREKNGPSGGSSISRPRPSSNRPGLDQTGSSTPASVEQDLDVPGTARRGDDDVPARGTEPVQRSGQARVELHPVDDGPDRREVGTDRREDRLQGLEVGHPARPGTRSSNRAGPAARATGRQACRNRAGSSCRRSRSRTGNVIPRAGSVDVIGDRSQSWEEGRPGGWRPAERPRRASTVRLTPTRRGTIILWLDISGSIFFRRGPDVNLRRPIPGAGLRLLEILLVLGLVRVPFPQADYHNVRHHHAAGEVCPHHDHLLRWHPAASQNEDVALLHWHWFLPNSQDSGRDPDDENPPEKPASGTAIHAHLYDGMEPDWGGDLVIRPSARGRCLHVADSGLTATIAGPGTSRRRSAASSLRDRACTHRIPRAAPPDLACGVDRTCSAKELLSSISAPSTSSR